MGVAEAPIQSYVLDRLMVLERQGKLYYFRNNSFTGRVLRYNGSQGYIKNSKKGTPDIIACFPCDVPLNPEMAEIGAEIPQYEVWGQFVGIEVKSKVGRQSPEQKQAQAQIEACGGLYWLIRSPEELEVKLKEIL